MSDSFQICHTNAPQFWKIKNFIDNSFKKNLIWFLSNLLGPILKNNNFFD